MKLALPTVTLVCFENVDHAAAVSLLHHHCQLAEFGAVRLLNHFQGRPQFQYWNNFEAWKYVTTDHALTIHLDGYMLNPDSWRPEWLEYDFVGAPWRSGHNEVRVGNDGFCLKSRKFMNRVAALEWHQCPADKLVCNIHRDQLVAEGYRFAPADVAAAFAMEEPVAESVPRPFGFHGPHFPRWEAK